MFIAYFKKIIIYGKLAQRKPRVLWRVVISTLKRRVFGQKPLRNVEIQVTPLCNSQCTMCFASRLTCIERDILSSAEIGSCWRTALKMGAVCAVITGGEPFLRSDLFEIIAALQPVRTIIGLLTNCLLVKEDDVRKLKIAGVDYLQVSLDGLSAAENDRIRGVAGHFEQVMRVIAWAKNYQLPTSISYTITHKNIARLTDICRFAEENDLLINPAPAVPVGNWQDNSEILLNDADWQTLSALIVQYPSMRLCFSLNYEGRSQCPAGREKFCLSPYGDVMGCSLNHISFGNIRDNPLPAIWRTMNAFPYFLSKYEYCRPAGEKSYIENVTKKINSRSQSPVLYMDL